MSLEPPGEHNRLASLDTRPHLFWNDKIAQLVLPRNILWRGQVDPRHVVEIQALLLEDRVADSQTEDRGETSETPMAALGEDLEDAIPALDILRISFWVFSVISNCV